VRVVDEQGEECRSVSYANKVRYKCVRQQADSLRPRFAGLFYGHAAMHG
jgi:hypothetical protein